MQDLIKKQQEETADTITDHFFRRGAVVSKKDYLYVLDLLQELQTELIKQTRQETITECVEDILEKLPELYQGTKRTEQDLTPDQIAYESGYSFCRTKIQEYKSNPTNLLK